METFRPVLLPVLVVYAIPLVIVAAVLTGSTALFAPLVLPLVSSLTLLIVIVFFLFALFRDAWYYFTEEYRVDDGVVRVRRGWLQESATTIPVENVAASSALMTVPLRWMKIGDVIISTNDGCVHVLHNVRDPERIAQLVGRAFRNMGPLLAQYRPDRPGASPENSSA